MKYLKATKDGSGRVVIHFDDIREGMNFTSNMNYNGKLNFFVETDYGRFYFKSNGIYSDENNEILTAILINGIKFSNYKPVPCCFIDRDEEKYFGILSKDCVKNRASTEIISYQRIISKSKLNNSFLSVENIMLELENFIKDKPNLKLDENILNDLKKLCLFYYITGQADLAERNIEFEITKNKNIKTISLATYVDNSINFFDEVNYKSSCFEINKYAKDVFASAYFGFMLNNFPKNLFTANRIICDLANEIVINPELKELYEKIKNFDFKAEIDKYKQSKPNFKLDYKNCIKALAYFSVSKNSLVEMVDMIEKTKNSIISSIKQKDKDMELIL